MKLKVLLLAVMATCIIGCSTDQAIVEEQTNQSVRFTVIGEDAEGLFEFRHNSELGTTDLIDLSAELDINGVFLTLRQVENIISYYSFSGGNFSIALKDIENGDVRIFSDFYANSTERSVVWGTNSKETVHFGFYNPSGSTNVGLRNIDIPGFEGADLQIGFDVQNLYQPLYHDKKLFITYKDVNNQYKVQVYSLSTKALMATLNFADFSPSLFVNDEENLTVLKSHLGSETQLEIYDFNSLELIESKPLNLRRFFTPGELNVNLIKGKLYYTVEYAQPSIITFGPAIYDIILDEEKRIDLISIFNEVQEETQKNLSLTVQGYSKINKQFYIGYVVTNNFESNEGGVLVISESGELIENISVPFAPIYFVKD